MVTAVAAGRNSEPAGGVFTLNFELINPPPNVPPSPWIVERTVTRATSARALVHIYRSLSQKDPNEMLTTSQIAAGLLQHATVTPTMTDIESAHQCVLHLGNLIARPARIATLHEGETLPHHHRTTGTATEDSPHPRR